MIRLTLTFLICMTSLKSLLCWWDEGHMLVAQVAELILRQEDPKALELAANLTNVLNPISHNKIKSFVESACWPDDVKKYGMYMVDPWHYLNMPVYLKNSSHPVKFEFDKFDGLGVMKSLFTELKKWNIHNFEEMSTQGEKSMMMRYLVHIMGDLHQPLHTATLYDDQMFPDNDEGGNKFSINFKKGVNNLHKLWDSTLGSYPDTQRPLTDDSKKFLEKIGKELISEFPQNKLPELKNKTFDVIVEESLEISKDFVYKFIKVNETPSKMYIEVGQRIARRRIALGGYRLAAAIKEVRQSYDKGLKSSKEMKLKFLE